MYIITGGAGFIGSVCLWKLNREGIDDILLVDNLGTSDKWRNLRGKNFVDYLHKNEFLRRIESGTLGFKPKAILHMGACSSTTETDAEYMMQNNYFYTRKLATWCLENKVRFIYASSAAAYGDGSLGFSDSDTVTPKLMPLNVYGYSKQLFDIWAHKSKALSKIVGLRFFNVFGPNEYHKDTMASVTYKAFVQISEARRIKLFKSNHPDYGDGEQKRDFIYVKDCADIAYWFLNNPTKNGVYNIGTGQARSWNDLATAIFQALDIRLKIDYVDMPDELKNRYQYFTEADVSKLITAGYDAPFTQLEDAVADYITSYLNQKDQYL